MSNSRVEWIDIAKGITILLVIVGHTIGGFGRGIIFSFHMPLFFVLSCITYKMSKNGDEFLSKTEKAFKHLFVPAFGIYFFRTIISVVKNRNVFLSYDVYDFKEYFSELMVRLRSNLPNLK